MQPNAPASPDPAGARLEKQNSVKSQMANRSHSVERSKPVLENMDKPPEPARPSLAQKNRNSSNANMVLWCEF